VQNQHGKEEPSVFSDEHNPPVAASAEPTPYPQTAGGGSSRNRFKEHLSTIREQASTQQDLSNLEASQEVPSYQAGVLAPDSRLDYAGGSG
jgi:hypothetical protein